jgi:two-component system response regulator
MPSGTRNIVHIEDRQEDIQLVKRIVNREYSNIDITSLDDSEIVSKEIENGEFLKRRPDLLLIDINMPKISGLELLEKLDHNAIYKRIPKVIFSSSTHPTDLENAYYHNANSYIEKPKNYAEMKKSLLTAVDYWLNINLK